MIISIMKAGNEKNLNIVTFILIDSKPFYIYSGKHLKNIYLYPLIKKLFLPILVHILFLN